MEIKNVMTKLTPAQAYAAQVRADRRAAALERRNASIAGDNARLNQLFKKAEVIQPVKVKAQKATSKRVRWTEAEFELIVKLYLKYVDGTIGTEYRKNIQDEFCAVFPERSRGSVALVTCQIKRLDTWHEAVGMQGNASVLLEKLHAAAPERFGAESSVKVTIESKIDALLAQIRG